MTYHHLSVLVHRQAEKYGEKTALRYRDYQTAQWIPISWNQFSKTVRQAANSLVYRRKRISVFSLKINRNAFLRILRLLPIGR